MRAQGVRKSVVFSVVLALVLLAADAVAQRPASRGRGPYGDWKVKIDFNGRQMESILSFSRDSEGNRTGHWISFWGMRELQDLKYEEGQLSFAQTRQNREGQTVTSKFKGTIEEGKLTGTLSSEMGELKVEGARMPRSPRAVGSWEIKFTMGEREITTKLVITADQEGNLKVDWPSERVQHTISRVEYQRGTLSFKTKSKMQDREWESTFEGRIRGDELTGTIKSERGEVEVAGTRVGAPLIGTWNLDIESERGARKQRLRVYPDMSGLYGAIPVKKVEIQDGKVSFKMVLEFGDRTFEMGFEGKLEDSKLTGELTTSRGSRKITGTKVERPRRGRRTI
jgi:hypothetical protein